MASRDPHCKPSPGFRPGPARRAIEAGLSRDRARLLGLWSKWNARPEDAGLR